MEMKTRITPLWIIAAFVTLTETVLGYALTKTTGFAQGALTLFVIVFALVVAGAFFYVIWHRPHVFYSPSEYGSVDPKSFIDALSSSLLSRKIFEEVAPGDNSARYELIDRLTEDVPLKQHLILMHLNDLEIPYAEYGYGQEYSYYFKDNRWGSGLLNPRDFVQKLKGAELVVLAEHDGLKIQLTERGKNFAQWLIDNKRQADYFHTALGGWGTAPDPLLEEAGGQREVVSDFEGP